MKRFNFTFACFKAAYHAGAGRNFAGSSSYIFKTHISKVF